MGIYRVQKNSNYVVMNKTSLQDQRLSWKAKGLHAYMLSMPDDWSFYDTELQKHAKDGRDSLKNAIKELKDLGYMKRVQRRNDEGKFDYETLVFEMPDTDIPSTENPLTEKPFTENPKLLSNDELNNKELNIYSSEFEQFWLIYPRKVDKKKAYKSFKAALKNNKLEAILNGTKKYAQQMKNVGVDTKYIKHPSTFLNNESFIDGFEESEQPKQQDKPVFEDEGALAGFWGCVD